MVKSTLIQTVAYPRPHNFTLKSYIQADSSTTNTLNFQAIRYDEGQGSPSSYYANPRHASFAEYNGAGTYPDSKINSLYGEVTVAMTTVAKDTDKLKHAPVAFIPYCLSFEEDYTAKDELSGLEVEDLIEMQHETTDNQGYPLYNGNKATVGAHDTLHADAPGLTTNQTNEYITFDMDQLYDGFQYLTNAGKLRSVLPAGIIWRDIRDTSPARFRFKLNLHPRVKRQNYFTACGVIVHIPDDQSKYWPLEHNMLSAGSNHFIANGKFRYLEWHPDFNMMVS